MSSDVPQSFYRISIKGLVLDEIRSKFLLVQEEDGRWEIPGGGLDHGEGHRECLRREIKEEMGIEVTFIADRPSFFLTFPSVTMPGKWVANVLYEIRLAHLNFTPSEECVALRFFTPEEALTLNAFPSVPALAKVFSPHS